MKNDMTQRLKDALQEIRLCRNNMPKEEFLSVVRYETADSNVGFPLLEAAYIVAKGSK